MSFWDPKKLAEQAKQRRMEEEKKRLERGVAEKKRKKLAAAEAEEKKKKWLELKKKHGAGAEGTNYDFKAQDFASEYAESKTEQKGTETKISRGFGSLNTKDIKKQQEACEEGSKDSATRNMGAEVSYPKLPRPF